MGIKKGGRRRSDKFNRNKVGATIGSAYEDGFESVVDTTSRDYVYDEVDQYHDDINKNTLDEAVNRMHHKKAKKTNVSSLGMDSSDDDEEEDNEEEEPEEEESSDEEVTAFVEDGDIMEEREDKLPDARAWGKDKSVYYGSNVTDQMIRKRARHLHLKAVEDAAMEELAAHQQYQQRMQDRMKNLDHTELLHLEEDEDEATEGATALEARKLSAEEQLQHFHDQSPEYLLLTNDAADKLEERETLLEPILEAATKGLIGDCKALEYVQFRWQLCSSYSLAVGGYAMILCAQGHEKIKKHPCMKKLAKYRYLFKQMQKVESMMKPQLVELVHRLKNNLPLNLVHLPKPAEKVAAVKFSKKIMPTHKLSILRQRDDASKDGTASKKVKFTAEQESDSDDSDNDAAATAAASRQPGSVVSDDVRRHIGYTITKNKGLTPKRKKEDSNPRIKYKRKYEEKLKKRKGQVRPIRKQDKPYDGEKTGINHYVVKSVKLK